jgi:hypothetical protein
VASAAASAKRQAKASGGGLHVDIAPPASANDDGTTSATDAAAGLQVA